MSFWLDRPPLPWRVTRPLRRAAMVRMLVAVTAVCLGLLSLSLELDASRAAAAPNEYDTSSFRYDAGSAVARSAVADWAIPLVPAATLEGSAERSSDAVGRIYDSTRNLVAPGSTVSGTARARQLGVEGELLAGIDPNVVKTRIPSLTGSANYRVPDALTDSVLTEVKNVQRLGYTSQIQDFSYYATQTGRQFDLVVRENTVLTRELQDIVNMTGSPINLIRGLPAG